MGYPRVAPLYGDLLKDLEATVTAALSVPCYATIPNPRPDRFVTFMLVGGGETSERTEQTRVLVDCWEQSHPAAHTLCQQVRQVVCTMLGPRPDGSGIALVDITAAPAFAEDLESNQPRFRFTANITRTPKEIQEP